MTAELGRAAPSLTDATRTLSPFADASTVAVTSLGDAADASGAKLAAADPIIRKSRDLARTAQRPTTDLAALLTSTKRTKGFERLMDLIYNTTGSVNGFDDAGHFLRTALIATNCVDYSIGWASGCDARFEGAAGQGAADHQLPADHRRGLGGRRRDPAGCPSRRLVEAAGEGGLCARRRRHRWLAAARSPRRAGRPRPAQRAGGPMRRGGLYSIGSSPVIVGALTVLITIIAVFLAYNATNGLPFVPTYRISVLVPDAAELVPNNEVRIGGIRVGLVKSITPVHLDDGRVVAKLDLVLNQDVDPLPGRLEGPDPKPLHARAQVPRDHSRVTRRRAIRPAPRCPPPRPARTRSSSTRCSTSSTTGPARPRRRT